MRPGQDADVGRFAAAVRHAHVVKPEDRILHHAGFAGRESAFDHDLAESGVAEPRDDEAVMDVGAAFDPTGKEFGTQAAVRGQLRVGNEEVELFWLAGALFVEVQTIFASRKSSLTVRCSSLATFSTSFPIMTGSEIVIVFIARIFCTSGKDKIRNFLILS